MKRQKRLPESLLPACEGGWQVSGLSGELEELHGRLQPELRRRVGRMMGPSCGAEEIEQVLRVIWIKVAEVWPAAHQHGQGAEDRARCLAVHAAREMLERTDSQLTRAGRPQARPDALAEIPRAPALGVAVGRVKEEMARLLGRYDADSVDVEQTFYDLGFASADLVELRNRLADFTGQPVPAALVDRSSTPLALAWRISGHLAAGEADDAEQHGQFEAFYKDLHPRLRRYAGHLLGPGCRDDVDDVMQSVWIAVLGNWRRIRHMEYTEAYLFRITRNEALKLRQATARRYLCVPPTDDTRLAVLAELSGRTQTNDFDKVLDEEWVRQYVAEHVAPRLSQQQLTIVLLAAAGYGTDAIADALDVAPATVRVQRHRLRRKLGEVPCPHRPDQ
ncbi:sigma-70 family RNA polymerase sigma factor [Streptomyces chartreusis]